MQNDLLTIDGKTYISSRRASRKYGYSIDYLGQLARTGKIVSKMFGRNRFVDENSLLRYQITLDNAQTEKSKVIEREKPKNITISSSRDKEREQDLAQEVLPEVARELDAEAETILPTETTRLEVNNSNQVAEEALLSVPVSSDSTDIFVPKKTNYGLSPSRIKNLQTPLFPARSLLGVFAIALVVIASLYAFNSDRSAYVANHTAQNSIASPALSSITFKESLRNLDDSLFSFLRKIENGITNSVLALRDYLRSFFGAKTVLVKDSTTSTSPADATALVTSTSTLAGQNQMVPNQSISNEELRGLISQMLEERGVVTVNDLSNNTLHQGVVAFPSTGNADTDAALRARVAQSFSDQVKVTLDTSGGTGIITPIFKNALRSEDYMFVLVPVKE